jgi:hypothetical protein
VGELSKKSCPALFQGQLTLFIKLIKYQVKGCGKSGINTNHFKDTESKTRQYTIISRNEVVAIAGKKPCNF